MTAWRAEEHRIIAPDGRQWIAMDAPRVLTKAKRETVFDYLEEAAGKGLAFGGISSVFFLASAGVALSDARVLMLLFTLVSALGLSAGCIALINNWHRWFGYDFDAETARNIEHDHSMLAVNKRLTSRGEELAEFAATATSIAEVRKRQHEMVAKLPISRKPRKGRIFSLLRNGDH